ncbi:GSCOCG00001862001-RA-CDS, partial [Cotesia congregata]
EILLRIDNTTAIAYINKAGGIKYPRLSELARSIWQWCESRNIWVVASYIPSKLNVEADRASRQVNLDTEWELSQTVFQKVLGCYGPFSIDLFASRVNKKCSRFCSRYPDPDAELVDAFTFSWRSEEFYAFPPFALILPALRKIINDKASGVLVVPHWPAQPWYPLFTSILCQPPLNFEPKINLLQSPFRQQNHPLA